MPKFRMRCVCVFHALHKSMHSDERLHGLGHCVVTATCAPSLQHARTCVLWACVQVFVLRPWECPLCFFILFSLHHRSISYYSLLLPLIHSSRWSSLQDPHWSCGLFVALYLRCFPFHQVPFNVYVSCGYTFLRM